MTENQPKDAPGATEARCTVRLCAYHPCGKEFLPKKPHGKFCSTECRMRAHGRMPGAKRDSEAALIAHAASQACLSCEALRSESAKLKAELAAAERERDELRAFTHGRTASEFALRRVDEMTLALHDEHSRALVAEAQRDSLAEQLRAAREALAKVRDWMGDPLAAHRPLSEIHTNTEILAIVTAALTAQPSAPDGKGE